jgi:hypothetical protein
MSRGLAEYDNAQWINATMKTFRWLMINKLKVAIGWTIVATLIPAIAILGLLLLVADWVWPGEPRISPDTYLLRHLSPPTPMRAQEAFQRNFSCAVRVTDGENTELYRTPLDAIPIWAKTCGSA